MIDLYIGLLIIGTLAIAAGVGAHLLAKRQTHRNRYVLLAVTIIVLLCFHLFLRNSSVMAWVLPFSNLVVIGNWTVIGVAMIVGIAVHLMPGGVVRRSWPLICLAGLGIYASLQPLVGQVPECRDHWDNEGICRQTSRTTCTAACAATLLRMHEIETDESEMARLCLTRRAGTTWQGLYRGLKLKTAGTDYRVDVFTGSAEDLREKGTLILTVGLHSKRGVDPIYFDEYGWKAGQLHTVMFFNYVENDRVAMADPDVGREQWSVEDLQVLYRGRGMRLVKRSP